MASMQTVPVLRASAPTDNNQPDGRFSLIATVLFTAISWARRATQQTSQREINVFLGKERSTLNCLSGGTYGELYYITIRLVFRVSVYTRQVVALHVFELQF